MSYLTIRQTIERRFTLKCVRDMIKRYSEMFPILYDNGCMGQNYINSYLFSQYFKIYRLYSPEETPPFNKHFFSHIIT